MSFSKEELAYFGITRTDEEFFASKGKPLEDVLRELASLNGEQSYPKTISPALISNGLIKQLCLEDLRSLENDFTDHWITERDFELFIPAAGAATRQLLLLRTILNHPQLQGLNTPKQLIDRASEAISQLKTRLSSIEENDSYQQGSSAISSDSLGAEIKVLQEVVDHVDRFWREGIIEGKFAFLSDLAAISKEKTLSELIEERNLREIARLIITPQGLNYGQLPKLLMRIHSYKLGEGKADSRLTFEEHLREAASLLKGGTKLKLHFPISKEHRELADTALAEILQKEDLIFFLERHGFSKEKFEISFSYQDQLTDSVSLLVSSKQIARDKEGKPLLRKSGHGALLTNLSQLRSDSIWINNVDNVLYDNPHIKRIVFLYKKAMASLGLSLERKLHAFIVEAEKRKELLPGPSEDSMPHEALQDLQQFIHNIILFLKVNLQTEIHLNLFEGMEPERQLGTLIELLSRPIIVAGFVPLEPGQAGGGPFAVQTELAPGISATKVNIVEQSEFRGGSKDINFRSGEFFNPVMLFVARRAPDGSLYPLNDLSDPSRFFRAEKTDSLGQVLLAYERPGLWNGGIVKAFQLNIALPSCVFGAIKDIAGKESPLAKLHQPYSGPAISELDLLRGAVDEALRGYLEQ